MTFGNESVVLTRVTSTKNAHGDITTTTATEPHDGVFVEPVYSTESPDPRTPPVIVGHRLYFPGRTVEADHDDVVLMRGVLWRVQGGAAIWTGSPGGTVITVVRGSR